MGDARLCVHRGDTSLQCCGSVDPIEHVVGFAMASEGPEHHDSLRHGVEAGDDGVAI